MSTHFKVTALKGSSAGGKHKVSKGGKEAVKGQVSFGRSLSSAKGRGFKGKLRALAITGAHKKGVRGRGVSPSVAHPATAQDEKNILFSREAVFSTKKIKSRGKSVTTGKTAARKKRVQGQAGSSALYLPVASETAPRLHKKKIATLYKKSGPHKRAENKGTRLKDVNQIRGLIHKTATRPGPLRAESKGHIKAVVTRGLTGQEFVIRSNVSTDKAQAQGKAPKLSRGQKGRANVRKDVKTEVNVVRGKSSHMKRAGLNIKEVTANKGHNERPTEVKAKKRPLKKTVEQSSADKPIDPLIDLPEKPVSLKARAEALRGGVVLPLKGASFNKGGGKKSRPAIAPLQAVKKAGSKRAGMKKKTVKRLNRVSGTPVKAAFEAQTDTLKGMGEVSEGVRLSEGLPFAVAASHEKAPGHGHGLSLKNGNGKAVFKDPSAIINASLSIATERTQARASLLTTAPKHDLAGRERELVEKASGGVLLSLRQADKEMVIKLSPAELGRMEIKVKVHHGLVEASILVDNPDVLAMLNANNTVLKDQLARQGLMLGGLEVALNRRDSSPHGRGELNHGESGRYGRGRQAVRGVSRAGEGPMAVKTPREGGARGGLDLFI